MDEIVLRGMAKWPNVPAVYGWLALDRRGQWLLKGERIANPSVTAFIGRNYDHDERGRWYFQNGPQRVFVKLDYTPLVLRVAGGEEAPGALETHTGKPVVSLAGAWLDEQGSLLLQSEHGAGILDDRDLQQLTACFVDANGTPLPEPALEELMDLAAAGREVPLWLKLGDTGLKVGAISARDVPGRFSFVREPEPPAGAEVCT